MDIQTAIKNTLIDKNYAVIPGIGGLVVEYEPARVNQATNTLTPPSYKLTFNPELKDPDNTIVNYLISKEKVDKTDAEKALKELKTEIIKDTEKGDSYELKDICSFNKDSNGNITVLSKLSEQLTSALMGYTSVKAQSFTKEETPKREEVKKEDTPKPSETIQTKQPVKSTIQPKKEKKNYALPVVLIVLALAIASSGIYFYLQKEAPAKKDKKPFMTAGNNNKKKKIIEETKKKQPVTKENDKYAHCTEFYIIAGSFKKHENASILQKELKKQGFDAQILKKKNNNYFRVTIEKFSERDTALKKLKQLKDSHGNEIWLLSI